MVKSIPIRKAIKQALRAAFIAKESRNREMYHEACNFIQMHISLRHSGKSVFIKV